MVASDSDELMNKRHEDAFGLIEYVVNVDELYEYQIRLIKAFVNGKNMYFYAPTGYEKSIFY